MIFHFTASCEADLRYSCKCQYYCAYEGNLVGLKIEGKDAISSVSISAYQHLECPEYMFGPGCENNCDCSEREACHYINGCYFGMLELLAIFVFIKIHDKCH